MVLYLVVVVCIGDGSPMMAEVNREGIASGNRLCCGGATARKAGVFYDLTDRSKEVRLLTGVGESLHSRSGLSRVPRDG